MEPKEPEDSNENLAWLGAAMSQSQTASVVSGAGLFAAFYCQLVADGMPDESAIVLTESFMLWQLDRAAEREQQR